MEGAEAGRLDAECAYYACHDKAEETCGFCHKSFCKVHAKPKLTGSLSDITSLKDPNLIKAYREEDAVEGGHPDPNFYEQFMANYRKEKERQSISFDGLIEMLDTIVADGEKCYISGCKSPAIARCPYCGRSYCNKHRSPTLEENAQRGHPDSNYTNDTYFGRPRKL